MESRIDARLAGMQADMARHREDMAKRDAEAAKRDTANIQWIVGTVFGATVVIIAVMSVLLR